MNPFEMVVLIVAIVMLASIIKSKGAGRRERGGPATGVETGENNRLREEVRALKERVAVLERLVTDERGTRDLDRQIEALRSRDA